MSAYTFCKLDKTDGSSVLPQMFRILYTNMTKIAPTGCTYEEDEAMWLSYASEQMTKEYPEYILMYKDDAMIGYFQYSIEGDTLMADEVEIIPEYQRTMAFNRLCVHLYQSLPGHIRWIESYVNKENANSLKINQKLGLEVIGENKSGTSWHLRGDTHKIKAFLRV